MNTKSPEQTKTTKKTIVAVDDHELILDGTIELLRQEYPDAEILTAKTAREVLELLENYLPNLVVMDLSIPEKPGMNAHIETGIQLLQKLMKQYPELNLMVQSMNVKALSQIKHEIDTHEGGLTIADKNLSKPEILTRVKWAMEGITHTKDLKMGLEVKPEWLEVLKLASDEGLQDKGIAKRMYKSERLIRHYWTKIQDLLEVYPEEDKNLRILTLKRAREAGLID